MKCPACGNKLATMTQSDLTVDVCSQGCGGIWFDHFELQKVDEDNESAGEALLHITAPTPVPAQQPGTKRSCPLCLDTKMFAHFISVRQKIEIDECPKCGGVWLDAGELSAIRHEFKSDAERKQAARQYFDNLFADDLNVEKARLEQRSQQVQKFANAVRFILPSYWIPGKQDGGAF